MAGKVIPMEARLALLAAASVAGVNVSALCRDFGVSRASFYRLRQRFDADGAGALVAGSRRPHRSPGQVAPEIEDEIVRRRKERPVDNGAQSIAFAMARDGWPVPAVSTVHRVLVRRGLVTPRPQNRPHRAWRRFEHELPNECWQIDATRWELTRGRSAWIMDTLDDHSRLSPSALVGGGPTGELAWDALAAGAAAWGWPASVLSDNGACFTGRFYGHYVDFEVGLAALGIAARHASAGHPQTCGKLERFHQTLKNWLRTKPLAGSYRTLQHQIDDFRSYYNDQRPHHHLHGLVPSERWRARSAATPGPPYDLPGLDPKLTITGITVDRAGMVNTAGKIIHVGVEWAHRHVTIARYGAHVLVLDPTGPTVIRRLTLDPTRRYQPSGLPRGSAGTARIRSQQTM